MRCWISLNHRIYRIGCDQISNLLYESRLLKSLNSGYKVQKVFNRIFGAAEEDGAQNGVAPSMTGVARRPFVLGWSVR
jgi:hypothetical protein